MTGASRRRAPGGLVVVVGITVVHLVFGEESNRGSQVRMVDIRSGARQEELMDPEKVLFLERYRGWVLEYSSEQIAFAKALQRYWSAMGDSWRTTNEEKRESLRRVCNSLFAETTQRQERLEVLRSEEPRPPDGYKPGSLGDGR